MSDTLIEGNDRFTVVFKGLYDHDVTLEAYTLEEAFTKLPEPFPLVAGLRLRVQREGPNVTVSPYKEEHDERYTR